MNEEESTLNLKMPFHLNETKKQVFCFVNMYVFISSVLLMYIFSSSFFWGVGGWGGGALLVMVYDFELQNSVCSGSAHYIETLHMIYVYRNYDKEIKFHFGVYTIFQFLQGQNSHFIQTCI